MFAYLCLQTNQNILFTHTHTHTHTHTRARVHTHTQGKYLADHKLMRAIRTREFKLSPQVGAKGSNIPYNIDGDPLTAKPIHVKVHQQRLRVFALPDSVLAEYTKNNKDKPDATTTTTTAPAISNKDGKFTKSKSELSYVDQFEDGAASDDEALSGGPKKDNIKWKMPRLLCREDKARKRLFELAEVGVCGCMCVSVLCVCCVCMCVCECVCDC